ncbi:MAG TPA: carboxypeptidase regulatory-like domain-containing protein [Candidatus Dormibacteraeota bacterium]|nr:carboxypeptidase regulatory-like domain-containing protein [Candidatus Dormibacteraeota bacterium]
MRSLSPTNVGSFGVFLKRSNLHLAVLLAALVIIFTAQGLAQEATILGTVTDPSGAAVANATVTLTNNDTGVTRTLPSNSDGQYVAPDLHIGNYTARATATGFKAAEQKNITLNVGDRTRIDFKLQVGSAQEQVTVEANAITVQTDSGEASTLITGQQITQLATNGRSLYELFALTPGASSIQSARVGFTPVSGDSNVSVNGQRAGHNLQLIDGGENLDRGGSSGSVMPSIDSIAEFRNMTSNYSAEYGLATAATISTVIKSGSKQFHAEAWEFFRNDALNARNYFNPRQNPNGTLNKVAELRYNIFGFNVGGKIPGGDAHPTFFFYNQEWRREVDGGLLNNTFPLASSYPDAGGTGTGAVLPATFNGKPTNAVVPTGVANFGSNCSAAVQATLIPGSPFPGNTIPSCLIDSNATALLNGGGKYGGIFPAPNNGAFFQGGNNTPTYLTEQIARVDHQFSSKFSIFGHWISEQISQTYGTSQWSGDSTPSVGDTFGNPSYSAVVHATHVISPTLLNEVAFNYNGNRIHILPVGLVSQPSSFTEGPNRLFNAFPNTQTRIPSINLSGVTGSNYTVNWMPWNNKADDYQFRDDLSWTKGAHQFKFGFSWAMYKKIQDAFANTQGNFTFNGAFSGYDYADFVMGLAQSYSEDGAKISGHWNNISPAAYVQDNWRVNNRLTLNLGLRWDGIPHTYEASQLSSNFYPNLYDPNKVATFDSNGHICSSNSVPACAGGASPGLVANSTFGGYQFYLNGIGVGGKNGIPKGLVDSKWNNWGPRLGFAYDLTGQGKTVIRGGFGIMYERIQGNDMYNGAVNPPGDPNPTLNNVSLSNPGLDVTSGNIIAAANLPVLPLGVTGIAQPYKPPTSTQYSLGVQQALGTHTVLNVSYVGSQGRHQNFYQAVNLPPLADLPGMVAAHALNNEDVTYPGFGGIRLAFNEGNSKYNSLQTSLTGTVHHDLHLQVAYTFSKADDSTTSNGSGGDLNNATNPYAGWPYNYGPSQFDRRSVFFANFVYDIPLFRSDTNKLLKGTLGGWQFSGIITEETGAPLNLGASGETAASIIGNTGTRPFVSGSISYPKTVAQWFSGNFTAPTQANGLCLTGPDCYGNMPFNGIRGPGRNNFDLALMKNFAVSERFRMEFRAEAFNAWNHTQFNGDANNGGIGLNAGAGNFGEVTKAFDGRQWQLALKAIF